MLKILADVVPLLVFFVGYQLGGMQAAVGSLLVASPAALLVLRATGTRPTKFQLGICAMVMTLCAITLFLRNPAYIMAKPTIVYWGMAIAVAVATAVGANPARAMFAKAFEQASFPDTVWRNVALQWMATLAGLGALNWLLAVNLSESAWVTVKSFVFPLLIMLVIFAQVGVLWRRAVVTSRQ